MNACNMVENQAGRHILTFACTAALAGSVALVQPAHADYLTPPPVPSEIEVQPGNEAFLKAHAFGTQNYVCLPSKSGFAWTFFGPQATLFNRARQQVITHFLSPNPFKRGTPQVTWQHSGDSSTVWGTLSGSSDSADFVAPGAIPWLLVEIANSRNGPTGGHTLKPTTFIQRLNTHGGVAPSTGCSVATDVGKKALVPYSADYFFYRRAGF
ncbi:MAG: hypothetical protein H6R26_707 [Proteobacteria bacterium]|nr:hypothetical protein [Pseudomonadota bacterium]